MRAVRRIRNPAPRTPWRSGGSGACRWGGGHRGSSSHRAGYAGSEHREPGSGGFGVLNDRARFRASTVLSLPEKLRGGEQRIFEETGGIHSAGLFDSNGEAIFSAEDVGRHNAVDKVIGFMLMNGIDGRGGKALQVSGRAGFEIVQKLSGPGLASLAPFLRPPA